MCLELYNSTGRLGPDDDDLESSRLGALAGAAAVAKLEAADEAAYDEAAEEAAPSSSWLGIAELGIDNHQLQAPGYT